MTGPVHGPTGVVPILVTPFRADGSIDLSQLHAELDFLVSAGTSWVGIGYGSEVNKLDAIEVAELVGATVELAGGRLKVLGNAEMASTRSGVAAVNRAVEAGAAAVMVRPVGLTGCPVGDVVDSFVDVARETGAALVVQDAPQNTGVELSAAALVEIARRAPTVVALKIEPPAPAPKMSAIRELAGADAPDLLGGLGGAGFVQELSRGAVGTMPGPAFPDVFTAVHRLFRAGDRQAATALLWRIAPFTVLGSSTMESFLFIQKYLLVRRGIITGTALRGPHRPIDALLRHEIDDLFDDLDILGLLGQGAA